VKSRNLKPNPGSPEAGKLGCKCPVLDNGHGKGSYMGGPGTFIISGDCQLHGQRLQSSGAKKTKGKR
jgi:hypothetical protein